MRGTLTIGKQLLQGFWESRKIALWVKCHREGSKWFHGTTSLSRVSPASNFGCWSRRKVPQDFKIQWVTAPFPSWSIKKKSHAMREHPSPFWWEPWACTKHGRSSQLLAALLKSARGAPVYLCPLLDTWWKVWQPSRQTGWAFRFGFWL